MVNSFDPTNGNEVLQIPDKSKRHLSLRLDDKKMQDFQNYAMSSFVVSPKKPHKNLKTQNHLALPVEDSQEREKELRSVTSTEIKQFKTVFIDGLAPK